MLFHRSLQVKFVCTESTERLFTTHFMHDQGPPHLLGILGGRVPPGSTKPDPISDQKMSFSTPVFRPDL